MVYSAETVANWFLAHNAYEYKKDGESIEPVTHLKLQKLLYYAQGAYLAIYGVPLFNEDIVAWEHGPVVKEVYDKFHGSGNAPLDADDAFNYDTVQGESLGVLREVYNTFGQYSAWKLRNMTHDETPWRQTPKNDIINNGLIQEYFQKHYVE